jgi:hypothetical protein
MKSSIGESGPETSSYVSPLELTTPPPAYVDDTITWFDADAPNAPGAGITKIIRRSLWVWLNLITPKCDDDDEGEDCPPWNESRSTHLV